MISQSEPDEPTEPIIEVIDLTEEDKIILKEREEKRRIKKEKHDAREIVNRKVMKEYNYHMSIFYAMRRKKIGNAEIKAEAKKLFGEKLSSGGDPKYTRYSAEELRNAMCNLAGGNAEIPLETVVCPPVVKPKPKPKSEGPVLKEEEISLL
jgi:hypothetical protein